VVLIPSPLIVMPSFLGKLPPSHLQYIISRMVAKDLAVYEPAKQTRSVLLCWRLPEEWAEVLHEWVRPNDRALGLHTNHCVPLSRHPRLASSILS
jgi:hypothetical protein